MELENSLNYLFSEVTNDFWNALELSMQNAGLHSGQIFVLICLWNEEELTQVTMAEKLNLSAPTVNRMVKSLSDNGFVDTRRSRSDGRKVKVFLTDKGREIKSEVIEQWKELEDGFFNSLSETEKLILFQIFGKLKQHLRSKLADDSA